MEKSLALNPVSGVVHRWGCGLGPARGGIKAPHADGYVPIPLLVLRSLHPDFICTRCMPREANQQ